LTQNVPVILAGDYNVAPTSQDIYQTRSWDDDALIHPKSRAAFQKLLKQGWVDAIRKAYPNEPMFTFLALHAKPMVTQRGVTARPFPLKSGAC
jgi:exodeoxyribonuclease-3